MIKIIALVISAMGLSVVLYLLFSKKQKTWQEMTRTEQTRKKVLIASAAVVFVAGLLAALYPGKKK